MNLHERENSYTKLNVTENELKSMHEEIKRVIEEPMSSNKLEEGESEESKHGKLLGTKPNSVMTTNRKAKNLGDSLNRRNSVIKRQTQKRSKLKHEDLKSTGRMPSAVEDERVVKQRTRKRRKTIDGNDSEEKNLFSTEGDDQDDDEDDDEDEEDGEVDLEDVDDLEDEPEVRIKEVIKEKVVVKEEIYSLDWMEVEVRLSQIMDKKINQLNDIVKKVRIE